ncbi:MAG: hypothetical protein ACRD68_15180, partial [Pyrinomonadaceae bacterium]
MSLWLVLPLALTIHAEEKSAKFVVRVAAESVARAERLTLGDIADVRGGDEAANERLRGVALGFAPNVGAVRELQ